MSKALSLVKRNASNPKLWLLLGLGLGLTTTVLLLTHTRRTRRTRRLLTSSDKNFFGAFIHRFELLPFRAAPNQTLRGLTFAVKDIFHVKGTVTGFGNPDWKKTHPEAEVTALVVTALLSNGATCLGKTLMDEFSFGISGQNQHYGTPINPRTPSCIPGGSSSGSAVAVAAGLVDFAIGTDTTGCVRIPAAFCGILGFRPSHGAVTTIGVLPNAQSLDTVGWFARDPSVLSLVGHVLLQSNSVETKRIRQILFADDLFQLSKVPKQKTISVISKAIKTLTGYPSLRHMNLCEYIASKVPSLKGFCEQLAHQQDGTSILKALSTVMLSIQGYEFKANHEEWVKHAKPRLGYYTSDRVIAAMKTTNDNIKALYRVRTEMRAAFQCLLKDDGILVIPTVADNPLKLSTEKEISSEFHERAFALSSIASISGCCQVAIPVGEHNDCCVSVSFISSHGADKFLLDAVFDMYKTIQEQVNVAHSPMPASDTNGNLEIFDLLENL
ncbi:hypothetical protein PIB30_026825 [Stylosanthes scabra]|uniref:Amidase domain-containing protein n=1 Tax=Stylosanthes scabra TaxID=79078 RepID=A0ABU6QBW5_9FABA|nr:hypothetical protein [Stylosanthes scabra]